MTMKNNPITLLWTIVSVIFLASCSGRTSTDVSAREAQIDSLQARLDDLSRIQEKEENNKKMVVQFYQELFGDKDIGALDHYIGEVYIQHNPSVPDGKEALRGLLKEFFRNAPKDSVDFRHVAADGDLVFLHIRASFGGSVSSVVDIFRVEGGKIVEHWDVIQEVPEESVNPHPMF